MAGAGGAGAAAAAAAGPAGAAPASAAGRASEQQHQQQSATATRQQIQARDDTVIRCGPTKESEMPLELLEHTRFRDPALVFPFSRLEQVKNNLVAIPIFKKSAKVQDAMFRPRTFRLQ